MSAAQTSVRAGAPEFRVQFTGLDTLGGERLITLPTTVLSEALQECEDTQANQELYQLPVDAAVWWRPAPEAEWRPWTGGAL